MTESAPALNDPFAVLTGPLAATTRMQLEVVDSAPLGPDMQRLVLTAPELAGLQYQPGQDMMLMVAVDGDRPVRRRYTIRALDHERRLLTLDVVRHADGPGERWVAAARPGDRVEGIGPRGKIFLAEAADWHLFIGDDAALPAYLAMAGALPAGARALLILEVPGPGSEQDLATAAEAEVTWLHRDGAPAGDPAALVGRPRRWRCRRAGGTPTWPARPRSCSGCGRRWPRAGWPRSRSRPRRTGDGAGRTPPTANPPRTARAIVQV